MADQQKVVYDLLNGAIFSDLERPQTHISRSGHSIISEMAKDTAIIAGMRIGNRTQAFKWYRFQRP